MLFDDEFSTVPFVEEVAIPPNWIKKLQHSSHIGAPDNIEIKVNWFTPDLEEDTSKTPSHNPSFAPEKNNKTITSSQSKTRVQNKLARKRASEVHERLPIEFKTHQI